MSVYAISCAGLLKIGVSDDPERRTANLFKSGSRYSARVGDLPERVERRGGPAWKSIPRSEWGGHNDALAYSVLAKRRRAA